MTIDIIVCVKQVMDPETPASAFDIDPESNKVVEVHGIPPVVNGFDENAVEAALRLKDDGHVGKITVLALGDHFVMDVMKKPLSMGADELVLVQDESASDLDPFATSNALAAAIEKIGRFDLILCGRQASDWDQAHVPIGIAHFLGLPVISFGQNIEISDEGVVVHRSIGDGYEVVGAPLPAVVSVTNELGEPRYPNLRGIMQASRKAPIIWSREDIGLGNDDLSSKVYVEELYIPVSEQTVEMIEGEDDEDSGRKLALRLREEKLI